MDKFENLGLHSLAVNFFVGFHGDDLLQPDCNIMECTLKLKVLLDNIDDRLVKRQVRGQIKDN
jgi:hypothetical protein